MEDFFSNRMKIYLMEALDRNKTWVIPYAILTLINMLLTLTILIKTSIAH